MDELEEVCITCGINLYDGVPSMCLGVPNECPYSDLMFEELRYDEELKFDE